ncbi:DUF4362 domain-containing protein [Aquibacillus saliphilus]|uniref:DUF4362 domain-containing protein n=1 Tax=Aquibacillus saliphilus TaxID=1909422 RepID=UPI001CEFF65A|nr:DUF4362 domain-containing protein [Aquibacillus saliphilus]
MKKRLCIALLFMLVALAACGNNNTGTEGGGGQPTVNGKNELNVQGVNDVDVTNMHGRIQGWDKMEAFYENMQKGIASDLRVVHYTTEGDPMVTDLTYAGESLEIMHDTSRDAFGSGGISTNDCGNLIKETNYTNTSYIAIDCNNGSHGMDEILQMNYNMSQQDRFELELKYGVDLENEINTLTNTKKKATETKINSELDLPDNVMQEVYKRLVLTNYLAEKELQSSCEAEDAMDYHLKVHINGGEQNFRWAACDQSKDGVNLTQIAAYIIEQSENTGTEKQDVTVGGYVLEIKDGTMLIGQELNMLDYQSLKDEIKEIDLEAFVFDFTSITGVNTAEFNLGDKIHATIEGKITGSNPGMAKVKEIEKLESVESSN